MTTIEYELEQRIGFDTLDCYVLSETSDSSSVRVYRCEDDYELAVIEVAEDAPANEIRTTLASWQPVGDDLELDEVIVREDGQVAVRHLARRR